MSRHLPLIMFQLATTPGHKIITTEGDKIFQSADVKEALAQGLIEIDMEGSAWDAWESVALTKKGYEAMGLQPPATYERLLTAMRYLGAAALVATLLILNIDIASHGFR